MPLRSRYSVPATKLRIGSAVRSPVVRQLPVADRLTVVLGDLCLAQPDRLRVCRSRTLYPPNHRNLSAPTWVGLPGTPSKARGVPNSPHVGFAAELKAEKIDRLLDPERQVTPTLGGGSQAG